MKFWWIGCQSWWGQLARKNLTRKPELMPIKIVETTTTRYVHHKFSVFQIFQWTIGFWCSFIMHGFLRNSFVMQQQCFIVSNNSIIRLLFLVIRLYVVVLVARCIKFFWTYLLISKLQLGWLPDLAWTLQLCVCVCACVCACVCVIITCNVVVRHFCTVHYGGLRSGNEIGIHGSLNDIYTRNF